MVYQYSRTARDGVEVLASIAALVQENHERDAREAALEARLAAAEAALATAEERLGAKDTEVRSGRVCLTAFSDVLRVLQGVGKAWDASPLRRKASTCLGCFRVCSVAFRVS